MPQDNWNRFDFFLVATSLLDQFATDIVLPFPPMMLRIVRVARILRIMRLLKGTLLMATDGVLMAY